MSSITTPSIIFPMWNLVLYHTPGISPPSPPLCSSPFIYPYTCQQIICIGTYEYHKHHPKQNYHSLYHLSLFCLDNTPSQTHPLSTSKNISCEKLIFFISFLILYEFCLLSSFRKYTLSKILRVQFGYIWISMCGWGWLCNMQEIYAMMSLSIFQSSSKSVFTGVTLKN